MKKNKKQPQPLEVPPIEVLEKELHRELYKKSYRSTLRSTVWGCGRFLGPELSNSKTASILHRTQTP